jgi:hypothetical protein
MKTLINSDIASGAYPRHWALDAESTALWIPGSSPRMTEGSSPRMTASVIPAKAGIYARRMDPRVKPEDDGGVKPEDDEMPSLAARNPQALGICTLSPRRMR